MLQIDVKAVKQVYSGNHRNNSCRCGCLGKYYASSEFAALSNWANPKPAGDYSRIADEAISDKMVRKVVGILNDVLAADQGFGRVEVEADWGMIYDLVLPNGRTYTVYITE